MKFRQFSALLIVSISLAGASNYFDAAGQSALFDLIAGNTTGTSQADIISRKHTRLTGTAVSVMRHGKRNIRISWAAAQTFDNIQSVVLTDLKGCRRASLHADHNGISPIDPQLSMGMYLITIVYKTGANTIAPITIF